MTMVSYRDRLVLIELGQLSINTITYRALTSNHAIHYRLQKRAYTHAPYYKSSPLKSVPYKLEQNSKTIHKEQKKNCMHDSYCLM